MSETIDIRPERIAHLAGWSQCPPVIAQALLALSAELESTRRESERNAATAMRAMERADRAEGWRDHDKERAEEAEAALERLRGQLEALQSRLTYRDHEV